jgi:RNA polymerase sigma-70 factor (ECF subfamily)
MTMKLSSSSRQRNSLRKTPRPYDTDETIVAGLRSGDPEAVREAMSRYAAPALGMATRICGDAGLAQEAAQDAFLALWERADAYDSSRGSLKTLVVAIARNKAIDLVRRERAAREVLDPLKDAAATAGAYSPLEDVDQGREVEWALGKLTPVQRDALSLAYFGGRTYREVAYELRIPEGTAKTRIRDGLARLGQLLSESQRP